MRCKIDRRFALPFGHCAATFALYLGFLAVMAIALMNAELALPMAKASLRG